MTTPLIDAIQIETGPNPTASVIWMHGLGADGGDFVPIVRELNLNGCPSIRFIFPHAPTMPVTINNGYVMRAWYDLLGMDLVTRQDEAGLRKSQAAIEQLIAQEKSRGVAADHIVLAGFSQGCAMTLQVGLRHPEKLAGMLCLSGYVPIAHTVAEERQAANQDTPIFMAHGSMDPVVTLDRAEISRDLLTSLGYAVDWHTYPMQHAVCPQEIYDIGTWFRTILR